MRKEILLGTFAIGILMTGCINDSVNTYENATKAGTPDIVMDKRVITDGFLKRRLVIKEIRQSQTNDNFKRIQVFMKSGRTGLTSSDSAHKVIYRFDWFDRDGAQVKPMDDPGWQKKLILPGDDTTFTSVAPTENCVDFRIRIKEAD